MEIVERSIADKARRGCMLVNTGLEVAPHEPEFRKTVAREFSFIEEFFRSRIEAGQASGALGRPGSRTSKDVAGPGVGVTRSRAEPATALCAQALRVTSAREVYAAARHRGAIKLVLRTSNDYQSTTIEKGETDAVGSN